METKEVVNATVTIISHDKLNNETPAPVEAFGLAAEVVDVRV